MPAELSLLREAASDSLISWTPGETTHGGLSDLQARSRLGADPPGGRPALLHRESAARARVTASGDHTTASSTATAAAPPKTFDWRKAPGGNYVTPVRDQAACGSCVAFGTVGVLESMVRIAAKQPGLSVDLSEAFVFFCLGPRLGAGACPEGGWWVDDALPAMKAGVSDEANYRYTDDDQPCRRGSDWKTRLTTFGSWTHPTSITAMKTHLATVGPLVACFTVYEDFFYYYTGGIYTYRKKTAGDVIGGHCVMIVGYDDATKCWIVKNSWGKGWGENGYCRIAYGSAGTDAEMWGIKGPISSPLIRTSLQLVAAGAGQVWRTTRSGSGSWRTAVERVDAGAATDPGAFTTLSAATSINRLHVVGLVGGQAWYTRQRTGAGWAKWAKPSSTRPAGVTSWTALSCAAIGDAVHVAALAKGALWHTLRAADGTWQKAWTRVSPATGGPGTFTALTCAAVGSQTSVVGIVGGTLWLTARATNGAWSAPKQVVAAGAPGAFTAVSSACVDGLLHLVALSDGRPWHLIRDSAGTWGSWRHIASASASAPVRYGAIACTDVGRTLPIVALAAGVPWFTLRNADGSWRASFASLANKLTGEPSLNAVDVA